MKKVVISAAILFFSTAIFAQSDVQPNVIKINPLGALFGSASLGFEHALNEQSSVVVLPSFGLIKFDEIKYTAFGIGAEYRFYFTGTAPRGTYVAPGAAAEFGSAKFEDSYSGENDKTDISGFSAKAVIGHQWIWRSRFVLDLNGGIQYLNFNFKNNTGEFADQKALSAILPALNVAIGFNF